MIWVVIWTVFMILWLFGGGFYVYNQPNANPISFGTGTLIPWLCVAIIGWVVFGGGAGPMLR